MSLWHCHDIMSGERFECRGDVENLAKAVEDYIRDGIDHDTGSVQYDVTCTAIDGSEHNLTGTVEPND